MTTTMRPTGGAYVPKLGYDRDGAIDINGRYENATLVTPTLEDVESLTVIGTIAIENPDTPELTFGTSELPIGRAWWGSGIDQAAAVPLRDFVVVFKGYTFSVTDGVIASGDATIQSATANFNSSAVGYVVEGAGIPAGTTIVSVTNSTTVELSANATATASGVTLAFSKAGQNVNDLIYVSHNGFGRPTVGIGKTQPASAYRLYLQASDLDLTQGALKLLANASQTGDLLSADSQNHVDAFRLKTDGSMQIDATSTTAFQVRNNGGTSIVEIDTSVAGASKFLGALSVGTGVAPTATLDVIGQGFNDVDFKLRTSTWGSFRILASGNSPGLVSLGTPNSTPMAFKTNDTERMRFLTAGHAVLSELAADPSASDLTSGANAEDRVAIYMKNDKIVFAYNRAGTVTYLTCPLDGATTSWSQGTGAP